MMDFITLKLLLIKIQCNNNNLSTPQLSFDEVDTIKIFKFIKTSKILSIAC